jgi:threonyl-tRNA synthetase
MYPPLNSDPFFLSVVQGTDYEALETLAKSVVKDKQKFERLEVSKEDLLKMFEVSSTA